MHFTPITDVGIDVTYDVFKRGLEQVWRIISLVYSILLARFQNATFISWPRADLVPRATQDKYSLARNTTIMLGKCRVDFRFLLLLF